MIILSCGNKKTAEKQIFQAGDTLSISHAKGFSIIAYDGFKILEVKNPWPKAQRSYKYLLVEDSSRVPVDMIYDHKINIPIKQLVVTSTTHIPSLESLGVSKALIGFPGLDYISSPETRKLIKENKIAELGKNESINTEILISISPDAVIGFAVTGSNKTFSIIENSGIPVLFNGDWIEESPLGKAEWIKFFGVLFNKSAEADSYFSNVERNYNEAKALASTAKFSPSVLSGSMYKDQWYVPYGNSWPARFIKDANARYIYEDTNGSGSMALAFESVLAEAQNADYWIAPGQFISFKQLDESSNHYRRFNAVEKQQVYTYSNTTGESGGVLYYELAPGRPDLVLKDLISIFHKDLLPHHKPVFFKPLD